MNDDQMRRVIEDFANSHTLAKDLIIEVTPCGTRMRAKTKRGAKAEDVDLLRWIITGAEHLLLWGRREKIVRFSKKKGAR